MPSYSPVARGQKPHIFLHNPYQHTKGLKANKLNINKTEASTYIISTCRIDMDSGIVTDSREEHYDKYVPKQRPKSPSITVDVGAFGYDMLLRLSDRYSIANTGHRGTLRMFVLMAGISHNRKMAARRSENQIT